MYLILAASLAFILSIVFTLLIKKIALKYNIVDKPDKARKIHKNLR